MYMSRADITAASVVLQRALISVKGRCVCRSRLADRNSPRRKHFHKQFWLVGSLSQESTDVLLLQILIEIDLIDDFLLFHVYSICLRWQARFGGSPACG
jgi:hypothetical protein